MHFLPLFTFVFLACTTLVSARRACSVAATPGQVGAGARSLSQFKGSRMMKALSKKSTSSKRSLTLPIYWHVIMEGESLEQGNVPDSQVRETIKVLNKAYRPTGIKFNLKKITRTTNADWFNGADVFTAGRGKQLDAEMKSALRVGGADTINIFTVGLTENLDNIGYASYANNYPVEPEADGVVILYSTLAGGSSEFFNLGHTVTHEVGHWLGLWHTFEGGCEGQGDEVADTAPQASGTEGCPKTRDSCTGDELEDPINNYMDISDDSCMSEFTPGQVDRIFEQIAEYRGL